MVPVLTKYLCKKLTMRNLDIVVISDVHLGTYGCQAEELLNYLRSIDPKTVILNGDIVDIWQFNKRYWPKSHNAVIQHLMGWLDEGKEIYYLTGNHDEMLRKFVGVRFNNFHLLNKIVLPLENGEKAWIFHGDVFDVTMQYSKWLAKLGGKGYDVLIMLNSVINFFSVKLGRGKISLSKKIKNSVKGAVKFINNFEQTAADIAIQKGYDYVICGHIHQPEKRKIKNNHGEVKYLNSGDWVENLTSLEYTKGKWTIFRYEDHKKKLNAMAQPIVHENAKMLFANLLVEMGIEKETISAN